MKNITKKTLLGMVLVSVVATASLYAGDMPTAELQEQAAQVSLKIERELSHEVMLNTIRGLEQLISQEAPGTEVSWDQFIARQNLFRAKDMLGNMLNDNCQVNKLLDFKNKFSYERWAKDSFWYYADFVDLVYKRAQYGESMLRLAKKVNGKIQGLGGDIHGGMTPDTAYWCDRDGVIAKVDSSNVNWSDESGFALLMLSCVRRIFPRSEAENDGLKFVSDRVKTLLQLGANVNAQNIFGDTALMILAMSGYYTVVQDLIDAGANLNLQNMKGDTALTTAISCGDWHTVYALVKAGADVTLQNKEGRSAQDMIRACGDEKWHYCYDPAGIYNKTALLKLMDEASENKKAEKTAVAKSK